MDVFVSSFRMCHEIPLEKRLSVDEDTVPLAELLLTKLQIIELNEKDVRDTVALLLEHDVTDDDAGVNAGHIAELCCGRLGPVAHDHARTSRRSATMSTTTSVDRGRRRRAAASTRSWSGSRRSRSRARGGCARRSASGSAGISCPKRFR